MTEGIVEFEDWSKLDLRVAQIKKVEDVAGADKLYKITIDVGELGERTICAGLKEYYDKKELKGKKIIYFSNLKPRMMKGIESQGMLLAASTEDAKNSQANFGATESGAVSTHRQRQDSVGHDKVVLISPEKDIENGSRIG